MDSILTHTVCGKVIKNKLYFSTVGFNGLFCTDIITNKCEFIDWFKGEKISESNLHKNCVSYGEWLFFLPERSRFIHAYNIKTREQNNIYIEEQEERAQIFGYDAVLYEDFLYSIPIHITSPLLRLDMNQQALQRDYNFSDWCIKNLKNTNLFLGPRVACRDGDIYIPVLKTNIILKWNIHSGSGELYKTVDNLFGISNAADGFWLFTIGCGDIFHWNPESGVKKYAGLQEWKEEKPYNHIIYIKRLTVIIPTYAEKLLIKCDSEDEFRVYDFRNDFGLELQEKSLFFGWSASEDILCIFFAIGRGMIVIDIANKIIKWQTVQLEDPAQLERIKEAGLRERMHDGNVVRECREWNVKKLINDIQNKNSDNLKAEGEFGKVIYRKLNSNENK